MTKPLNQLWVAICLVARANDINEKGHGWPLDLLADFSARLDKQVELAEGDLP